MNKYILFILILFAGGIFSMQNEINNQQLIFSLEINAPVEEVYKSWTTNEGIKTFFAPGSDIELKLFGNYHIYFFPNNPAGSRGAEDEILIAHQKDKILSFTWGFPPSLMDLRMNQKTIVLIRFEEINENKTKLTFIQSGWGKSDEWQKGFEYFENAWGNVVLARLKYRFEIAPVDWVNQPDLTEFKVNRVK